MSSWTMPGQGPGDDEVEKPVFVFPANTDLSTVYQGLHAQELAKQVHDAAALGWSMAELLGRCFLLVDEPAPPKESWDGARLVALPELHTPREQVRSLMEHIVFLAGILNVHTLAFEDDPNQVYADLLRTQVRLLCADSFDASKGETRASALGETNQRLFFWDLAIHDNLQSYPMAVHKAYIVGHTLAALRWYFPQQQAMPDKEILDKVCHVYIPLLAPYLFPFTPPALSNSVWEWGQAMIGNQVTPVDGTFAPQQLHDQAHIWYDLITMGRNPLTYVDTSKKSNQFVWSVLRIAWPMLLVSVLALVLIIAVLVIVIVSHLNEVVTAVTAVAGFLALVGTSHSAMSNVGNVLQHAVTQTGSTIKGSLVDSVWHSTQQKAINDATYIVWPGSKPQTK